MCRYFDVMGIFFLHSEIWGLIWELNKARSTTLLQVFLMTASCIAWMDCKQAKDGEQWRRCC
jgi:hypothetical protein